MYQAWNISQNPLLNILLLVSLTEIRSAELRTHFHIMSWYTSNLTSWHFPKVSSPPSISFKKTRPIWNEFLICDILRTSALEVMCGLHISRPNPSISLTKPWISLGGSKWSFGIDGMAMKWLEQLDSRHVLENGSFKWWSWVCRALVQRVFYGSCLYNGP